MKTLTPFLAAVSLLEGKINVMCAESANFPFTLAVSYPRQIADMAVQLIPQNAILTFPAKIDRAAELSELATGRLNGTSHRVTGCYAIQGASGKPHQYRLATQDEIRTANRVYDAIDLFLQIFHAKGTQSRRQVLRQLRLERDFIKAVEAL